MRKSMGIVLPENAVPLSMEEMRSVEGGSVNLSMQSSYLQKSVCQNVAATLLRSGSVTGMTALEIAQEIYAHAFTFYHGDQVKTTLQVSGALVFGAAGVIAATNIANGIIESAGNGIAIMDGGDSTIRKTYYTAIWNWF